MPSHIDLHVYRELSSLLNYRAEVLADQYRQKAQLYRSNVLLVPLGADFQYSNQEEIDIQFSNYEKLMRFINSHPEMRLNVSGWVILTYGGFHIQPHDQAFPHNFFSQP